MVLLLRITVGEIMAHVRVQSASTTLQSVISAVTEMFCLSKELLSGEVAMGKAELDS